MSIYWPASPSSGGSFDDPNAENRGDVHYWEVWHGNVPFSDYRKFYFRYISEFGFQSFPSVKTIETFTDDPNDMNIFSYIMEKHQRNGSANGKIMNYMQQTYRYPTDFASLIYYSQLLQADAIRYGVEHFRRNRNDLRCMGAIYWQLNWLPFEFEKSIQLCVSNESLSPVTGKVKWQLRNADASIVTSSEQEITIPPLYSQWMENVDLPQVDLFNQYVSYQFETDGQDISEGTVIFSFPKYFKYLDPKLSLTLHEDEIIVKAHAYAKSVRITNQNDDLILSDNYFDMNAGEKHLRILSGTPDHLTISSV